MGEFILERVMGIEPTLFAWEAEVLPLNYTRKRWTGSNIQSLIDFPQALDEAHGCRDTKAQAPSIGRLREACDSDFQSLGHDFTQAIKILKC